MINGEGAGEKISSGVTSPSAANDPVLDDELLPWEDQKSDGEDVDKSSQYSSCGESEFDRYCSANSAMGTPSFCSSVYEFPDSEFGSFKSFKLAGENRSLKNFGFDRKLSGFSEPSSSERGSEFRDGNLGNDEGFPGMSKGLDLFGDLDNFLNDSEFGFPRNDDVGKGCREHRELGAMGDQNPCGNDGFQSNDDVGKNCTEHRELRAMGNENSCGNDSVEENASVGASQGNIVTLCISHGSFESIGNGESSDTINRDRGEDFESRGVVELVDGCTEEVDSLSRLEGHRGGWGRFSDENETSSRHEHSEGEDSMFGCGSDDDKKADSYYAKNVECSRGEERSKDGHGLLLTSAVAFGSDDWDDFMQETAGNTMNMVVQDKFPGEQQDGAESEISYLNFTSALTVGHPGFDLKEQQEEVVDATRSSDQDCDSVESIKPTNASFSEPFNALKYGEAEQGEHVEGMLDEDNQVSKSKDSADYPESHVIYHSHEMDQKPLTEETPLGMGLSMGNVEAQKENQHTGVVDLTSIHFDLDTENLELEKINFLCNSQSDSVVNQSYSASENSTEDRKDEYVKENDSSSVSLLGDSNMKRVMENSPLIFNHFEDHFSPNKRENSEFNGFYDEMVHEMEEILLDTDNSPGSRFTQGNGNYPSQIPLPSRDGGSTASTSGTDDANPLIQLPMRIDGVEVVGARQKKGDVSLSERLVGVKEYTVYKIRIWSGEGNWEVERRYRDFCTLYHQLKKMFADQGWILPAPWHSVERESRKIFRNVSPDVIADRSVLIQDCLQSILQSKSSISLNALTFFLSPSKTVPNSLPSATSIMQSPFSTKSTNLDNVSMLGKTISLVVQMRPYKSVKQILDAQHCTCAGCHKNFDDGKTRMTEFVRTLGWGKPRLCEYSGQFFCSTCHTNDTAVLPARVLHHWDFAQYPVSQLAKSYLDSIYDKPMLCVSAVNPFLFSKVPALQHVRNVRKRIGAMIPYVRCPFRRSVYKGLGSRRYLLESNDFFALRDLIDLSKGMFAALPVLVETVSKKILEHITEQCLICCDMGIPCNGRQACNDPSSLIFPFQEGEVEKCRSCHSVFHRHCFSKIQSCPCGAQLKSDEAKNSSRLGHSVGSEVNTSLNTVGNAAESSFVSGFFSKMIPQRSLGHKEEGPKDGDTVILMGSLPTNAL